MAGKWEEGRSGEEGRVRSYSRGGRKGSRRRGEEVVVRGQGRVGQLGRVFPAAAISNNNPIPKE